MSRIMKVYDYELINNIELLFEAPIIIYGAGKCGREVLNILEGMGIVVEYFLDKDKSKKDVDGYKVINLEDISGICSNKHYNVIVASHLYFDEMIHELEIRDINKCYVFTGWSIEAAVSFYINKNTSIFSKSFKDNYRQKILSEFIENKRNESIDNLHEFFAKHPDVLIYQVGKVGSTSVYNSLIKYNVNCMHVHHFHSFDEKQLEAELLYEKLREEISSNGIKIITMVRDPIGNGLSAIMQGRNFYWGNVIGKCSNLKERFINVFSTDSAMFTWYENELEVLTGIDVFKYPFDRDRGYSVIRKGNIDILILTMENLNNNEKIISDFIGIKEFSLFNDNVGSQKEYSRVYKIIKKELKLTENILDKYYNNSFIKNFYTEEQICEFRNRWKE